MESVVTDSMNVILSTQKEVHALKSNHCKKEDCAICKTLDKVETNASKVTLQVPVKDCKDVSDDSNISLGICRICHCNPSTLPELGELTSVCRCRGTVALVHMSCLERWLSESDTSRCELCGFQYNVEKIPKYKMVESIFVWISEVADYNQVTKDMISFLVTLPLATTLVVVAANTLARLCLTCLCSDYQLQSTSCTRINHFLICLLKFFHYNLKFKVLMDTLWFWFMTPLAAMAGYIFVRAASEFLEDKFQADTPWLLAALLVNSCLTLIAYYGWVVTCIRQHVQDWYHWWQTENCFIKIHGCEEKQKS